MNRKVLLAEMEGITLLFKISLLYARLISHSLTHHYLSLTKRIVKLCTRERVKKICFFC
jgi:hypothetical protein